MFSISGVRTMKKTMIAMVALAAMAAGTAQANPGKDLFSAQCSSCHGMNAEGQGMFPKLAGHAVADTQSKLKTYRSGGNVGPMSSMMWGMAGGLSDQQIADVAAYLASIK
jgi:cytochrome c553